jgi:hypothetical protein
MLHMSFKMTKMELEASPKLNGNGEQLAKMEPKEDWWDNVSDKFINFTSL